MFHLQIIKFVERAEFFFLFYYKALLFYCPLPLNKTAFSPQFVTYSKAITLFYVCAVISMTGPCFQTPHYKEYTVKKQMFSFYPCFLRLHQVQEI